MKKIVLSLLILFLLDSHAMANEPLEHKLAVLDKKGKNVAENDITVERFRYLLQELDKKCVDSKQEIADETVTTQQSLENNCGIKVSLLDLMEGVNRNIPSGTSQVKYKVIIGDYTIYLLFLSNSPLIVDEPVEYKLAVLNSKGHVKNSNESMLFLVETFGFSKIFTL